VAVDDVFLSADVTAGPEIMGLQLRPLSVWHVWALSAMDSPYIIGGDLTVEAICRALMICTQTRAGFAELINTDAHILLLGDIAGIYLAATPEERADAQQAFAEYIDACTVFPEFWEDGKTDAVKDRLRCPVEWHIVAALVRMGIVRTEDQAWDYPIARARCWGAVEAERNGNNKYVDQRDRADMEKLNHG
jgi:hypothetical protein